MITPDRRVPARLVRVADAAPAADAAAVSLG